MQGTINSKLLEFCPACTREIWGEPNWNNPVSFLRLFKVKTHLALINIKGIEGYFAGACWHIELKKMVEVSFRLSGWSKNRNQRNTWRLLFSWDVVIISLSVTSKTTATSSIFQRYCSYCIRKFDLPAVQGGSIGKPLNSTGLWLLLFCIFWFLNVKKLASNVDVLLARQAIEALRTSAWEAKK